MEPCLRFEAAAAQRYFNCLIFSSGLSPPAVHRLLWIAVPAPCPWLPQKESSSVALAALLVLHPLFIPQPSSVRKTLTLSLCPSRSLPPCPLLSISSAAWAGAVRRSKPPRSTRTPASLPRPELRCTSTTHIHHLSHTGSRAATLPLHHNCQSVELQTSTSVSLACLVGSSPLPAQTTVSTSRFEASQHRAAPPLR